MASVGHSELINVRAITMESVTRKTGIIEPQQLPDCKQWQTCLHKGTVRIYREITL